MLRAQRLRGASPTVIAALLPLAAGCGGDAPDPGVPEFVAGAPTATGKTLFADATEASGIRFEHGSGATGGWILTEIMGGGGALFDKDRDGDLDLLLLQGGADSGSSTSAQAGNGHALFENDGTGVFQDVSEGAGLAEMVGYAMGAAAGDVNGDGHVDLYITQHGVDRLLLNGGTGRFTDVTDAWNAGTPGWSTSAAFADVDGDGDLDLYVTRYIELDPKLVCHDASGRRTYCPPASGPSVHDVLLRNDGDHFTDISREAGLVDVPQPGLGVVFEDLSGDGRADAYVANDGQANQLWVRSADGTWRDEAGLRGVALNQNGAPEASMGVVAEDFDADGLDDLFMTHLQEETHTLYRARAAGSFADRTGRAGLSLATRPDTGFGLAAFDLELDGDLDLAVANGRVRIGPVAKLCTLDGAWAQLAEQNALLVNDGGRFEEAGVEAGPLNSPIMVDRCVFAGDLDGDGDIDLVFGRNEAPAQVLFNESDRVGDWILIDPRMSEASATALGVRVSVAGSGIARTTRASDGYLTSRDPRVHLATPLGQASVDVDVRWPDGTAERFSGLEPGAAHTILRGTGTRR